MSEPYTRPDPSLVPIRRPNCPKCESRMMLASILPGPEGFDLRTFECRPCDHRFTTTVARDPMNAISAGWIAGELQALT